MYTRDFQPAVCRDYKNYLVIEQKISISPRCAGLSAGCDTWPRDGGGDGEVMVRALLKALGLKIFLLPRNPVRQLQL